MVPFAVGHDGRSFFATVYSSTFSGVAMIDAQTSAVTEIRAFPDPNQDQAVGGFDGRWLVWNEEHDFTNLGDFTVWAWDSRTGRLTQVGAAMQGPDGEFWESPLRGPDVRDGIATWVQGIGPDGLSAVHVYNLRTDQGMVVRRGHAQSSLLLDGHLVAWPESPSRGATTRMYVASAITGRRVKPPRALRELRGVSGLDTDGRRIAYPNAPYKSLWWSPSLRSVPRKILVARRAEHIDDSVQIGGRYIGFGIWPALFVGDTRTHRYVEVSDHGAWTLMNSRVLLVAYGTSTKALHPRLPIALVRLRDLPPLPACS
jgi:hypothetical protein